MSISSGSGASGLGASSPSSDASAMAQSTGSSGAGSICLANNAPMACSSLAFSTASRNSASLCARKRRHPVLHTWLSPQRSVVARAAHSADDCRRHALFMVKPSKVPSRTELARVALARARMQLLQLRKTATSQGCKYDVLRGGRKHSTTCGGGQCVGASVNAGHVPEEDPRMSFLARVQHIVQCGCELQDRGRRPPAFLGRDVMSVLRPGLLRQDGVCPADVHDLHQHVQRATVHAEGDRKCRGLLCVAL